MISNRTKASLSLCLSLHEPGFLRTLFQMYEIHPIGLFEVAQSLSSQVIDDLRSTINSATQEQLLDLLSLIIRTSGDLRTRISPRYKHDERWADLISCLMLDGYTIDGQDLVPIDPSIEGVEPVEDEFTRELQRSGLAEAEEITRLMNNSTEDFRRTPPDYNGCLTNARVALQTLATSIARTRLSSHPGSFNDNVWGQVLAYLRTSGLIRQREEEGISGVYSFVSEGAHRPVGLSEQEMARLGRSLVTSMCYFLIKLHNNP